MILLLHHFVKLFAVILGFWRLFHIHIFPLTEILSFHRKLILFTKIISFHIKILNSNILFFCQKEVILFTGNYPGSQEIISHYRKFLYWNLFSFNGNYIFYKKSYSFYLKLFTFYRDLFPSKK